MVIRSLPLMFHRWRVVPAFSRNLLWVNCPDRRWVRLWTGPNFQSVMCRSLSSDVHKEIYLSSRRPSFKIPNVTFTEFMFENTKQYRDSTALVDFQTGRSYTYTQLRDATIKLGSALYKLGYRKGDRLLVFCPNCPEYAILFMACASLGVVVSTCNPSYNSVELARQLVQCGATSVVSFPSLVGTVKDAIASSKLLSDTVREIIVLGESEGCRPFFPLLDDDGKSFPENVDIDPHNDTAILPFSSGTTGLPKGVMLTHTNIVSNIIQLGPAISMVGGKDSLLLILPMFHIYGMVASLFHGLNLGVKMVTVPRFDPDEFIQIVTKLQITQLQLVPPLVVFLTKDPRVGKAELSSVKKIISGAATLGKAVTVELLQKFDVELYQAFGMTETSPGALVDQHPPRLGSVGKLLANTDGKIVDIQTGEDLGPDQEGELCIRGPQVMKGYLDNEKATKETIKNNWLYTGDVGFYDRDEYFFITDRMKELIKYKGFQVPPAELEALILTHPDIQDCAVVGVADEVAGELPKAYVVAKPGKTINTNDVVKFVEKHVVSYKRLRGGVETIDAIPKTQSGKILRRELKEKAKK